MTKVFSLNFKIVPEKDAVVSVMDRSFLYGDSVYEVVRTYQGKHLFLLDRHFKRLVRSAEGICLTVPFSEWDIKLHLEECLSKAQNRESYIRIILSRGADDHFSLIPSASCKPTVVVCVEPLSTLSTTAYSDGIPVALVSVQRNHPRALDPSLKTGNYMNNMLALMEAGKQGAREAIMLNSEGFVTEATTSNVFMVKNGKVFTPELRSGILEGITRGFLREMMEKEKIQFEEKPITEKFFLEADEIFITGTIKEIMPVNKLNGKMVGEGKPGPLTQRLMKLFRQNVENLVSKPNVAT